MLSVARQSARRAVTQCSARTLTASRTAASASRLLSTTARRSDKERDEALGVFSEGSSSSLPPSLDQQRTALSPEIFAKDVGGITAAELATKDNHTVFTIPPERDPILHFLATSIMKHGRYAAASRTVTDALLHIHTLTRSPPIPILREAIARVSPAVRVATTKQGARQIVRPVPLNERQRVGKGIRWILEASRGKPGRTLAERVAKEVVAVVKGESGALAQKEQAHKAAMVARGSLKVR
ncbi:ribosomal protein S7 [Coprinellus micaceus]|uniref:Ribosomal protein S7 n=2 Tax=Coprinellus micaceus TaxID=71717 RepID=A0A4Y7S9J3_COPMI|nr:ribosomal protein S7 [Coprinellus micaceus]